MLKKRIIFTLLYCDGYFVHSRNFNLQKVGDVNWLENNYNFNKISNFIDELIIIDISRSKKNIDLFIESVQRITSSCFMPITLGGGIDDLEKAKLLLSNGADKVIINTNLNLSIAKEISKNYGEQSIIAGVDFKKIGEKYFIYKNNASKKINISLSKYLSQIDKLPIGEILLNSIDKDGTGNGLDLKVCDNLKKIKKSVIISGGCGNVRHFIEGLNKKEIDAISTANLLNFVGDGIKKAREDLLKANFNLPIWKVDITKNLKDVFK